VRGQRVLVEQNGEIHVATESSKGERSDRAVDFLAMDACADGIDLYL